jgi:cobalamin biosynthesis Mg chelatase CobN
LVEIPNTSRGDERDLRELLSLYQQQHARISQQSTTQQALLSETDREGRRYMWLPGVDLYNQDSFEDAKLPIDRFLNAAAEDIEPRGLHMLGVSADSLPSDTLTGIFIQLKQGLQGILPSGAKSAPGGALFQEVDASDRAGEPGALFSRLA